MIDKSGFDSEKQYCCKSCHKTSYGSQLLAIKRRRLEEIDGKIVEVGDFYISNRVCPYDRGLMEEVTSTVGKVD